jgi:hypothetical protein
LEPHAYKGCIRHVKETCDVDIVKENIATRMKTFDKHYVVISKMVAQSDFQYNKEKNKVMDESDEVWSRYVEVLMIISSV